VGVQVEDDRDERRTVLVDHEVVGAVVALLAFRGGVSERV